MIGSRGFLAVLGMTILLGNAVAEEQDLVTGPDGADYVVVDKSDRKLYLYRAGRILREFDVALGQMPNGPKQREGDFRTPEGKYFLDERNVNSDFFLSIHVSYPNETDRARARELGVDPGGQIMIHGLPNEPKYDVRRRRVLGQRLVELRVPALNWVRRLGLAVSSGVRRHAGRLRTHCNQQPLQRGPQS